MATCIACGVTFTSKYYMKKHLQSAKHVFRINNDHTNSICPCGKSFSKPQNLYRHRKNCSKYVWTLQQSSIAETHDSEDTTNTLRQEINHLKGQIEALSKTNTTQNASNIQNNTTNNHTNNITIINPFGQEAVDRITPDYFVYCLNRIYNSSPTLAEKIYSYPENQNIRIPNKNKPYASVQLENGESKLELLDRVLDEIENFCFTLLEEKFTDPEYRKKMSEMKQRAFENYMDAYENDNKGSIRKNIRSALKLMVLNMTDQQKV